MTRAPAKRGHLAHWKHRIPVMEAKIAEAERWLRERKIRFATGDYLIDGCYIVRLPKASDAMLFKLTWGGA